MNKHISGSELETPKVTTGPLPASRKVYASPTAAPDLRVPVREIMLDGAGLRVIAWRLGILAAWAAICLPLALKWFRWR